MTQGNETAQGNESSLSHRDRWLLEQCAEEKTYYQLEEKWGKIKFEDDKPDRSSFFSVLDFMLECGFVDSKPQFGKPSLFKLTDKGRERLRSGV